MRPAVYEFTVNLVVKSDKTLTFYFTTILTYEKDG